eukprot:maker-scaffold104_size368486-snap-gene-2.42 protein:Tk07557 transcript:maker-scaffold104_size368486-snap-gene-2.42-mRNA-1 annotation:"rb1-inducible coiled-coil protein 1"
MLCVFLVDTGTMLQLDMNLTAERVLALKEAIARGYGIPRDKQVLLISGGESLDESERVCQYKNAGVDTNPIFLFSMLNIEAPDPPVLAVAVMTSSTEIQAKVEASQRMADAQSTVAVRASIAQGIVVASSHEVKLCQDLILHQHMQYQGWLAVVANVEDTAISLQKRRESLIRLFEDYLAHREDYRQVVETFDDDIALLHQIPVFPSLLEAAGQAESMIGSVIPAAEPAPGQSLTLLEWINSRGSSQSLEQVADSCYRAIEALDPALLEELRTHVNAAIQGSDNQQMKEIKGLSERLQGLENILIQAQRFEQEQADLAHAFVQNQKRAQGLEDASILPDLCESHREQLWVMSQRFQEIVSLRKRCLKAKEELSKNLHCRMKWVVHIQNQMAEVGQNMVIHTEELRRLNRKLEVIEQLHTAPSIYVATAVEVVRRRAFSGRFLDNTKALSAKFSTIHSEEVTFRRNFQNKLKRHFLSKMFPGMDDLPPPYATESPGVFDHHLPHITLEDVEQLRKSFPDLAASLQVPDESDFADLLAKSINQTLTETQGVALTRLQDMPTRIQIKASGDINSMSMMNRAIADGGKRKSRLLKASSRDRPVESDSDTDTNFEAQACFTRNGKTYSRSDPKKRNPLMTRSLPMDESIKLVPATMEARVPMLASSESMTFEINKSEDVVASSSSADPSSSSHGNNSSVAPSSSSDTSCLKPAGTNFSSSQEPPPEVVAAKLVEIEVSYAKLQESVHNLLDPSKESLTEMRSELGALKDKILEDRSTFESSLQELNALIGDKMLSLHRIEAEKLAQSDDLAKAKEATIAALDTQLDLELHKLEDSRREVEMCHQQLEMSQQEMDHLNLEHTETVERLQQAHAKAHKAVISERDEFVKGLTLEHELEMDAIRDDPKVSRKMHDLEDALRGLKEELAMKEDVIVDLKRKTRILENSSDAKFQREKDKIVQILESGFAQRERLAIEKREAELDVEHDRLIQDLHVKHMNEIEAEVKAISDRLAADQQRALDEINQEHRAQIQEIELEYEEELQEKIAQEQKRLEQDKDKTLKTQAEKMSVKARQEVENLRSRFKMIQSSSGLDRTPTTSESELSIESPRSDTMDKIRAALQLEFDNNLRAERKKWEIKITQIQEEHSSVVEELQTSLKSHELAHHQVSFNEALAKVRAESSDAIAEVNQRAEEHKLASAKSHEELQRSLSELAREKSALESENEELKRTLESGMTSSVIPASESSGGLENLTNDSLKLKDKLTQSMISVVQNEKVSVRSVAKGDICFLFWSEEHSNFLVYCEATTLYFLHSDSVTALRLNRASKKYGVGQVASMVYCLAKKPGNRFNVEPGTKFYRVKCKTAEDGDIIVKKD